MEASRFQDADHPWLNNYPPQVPKHLPADYVQTLDVMLRNAVTDFADLPAFEALGASLTFKQSLTHAEKIGAWLQAQGLEKGDRVAVMCPNLLPTPICVLAVLLAGLSVVNVNPLYSPRELKHQISDSGAKALFVLENFAHVVQSADPDQMGLEKVVVISPGDLMGAKGALVNFVSRHVKKARPKFELPNHVKFASVLQSNAILKKVEIEPEDIAFLQYTGGTTGVSKGAVLRHKNVTANITQLRANIAPFVPGEDELYLKPQVMVLALPIYHIFGLTCSLLFLTKGAKMLLIPNPRDLDGFVKTLSKSHITMFSGVNTLYNALAHHPKIGSVDFSNMVFSVAGGMASQAEVARKWLQVSGTPIVEGYGLSETSPVVTMNPLNLEEFSGNIGFPLQNTDVRILDEDGKHVEVGQVGEIAISGPQVMSGYWQRETETANVMTDEGYFKTGDLGFMHSNGAFEIVDRKKDLILVSGFNVYPNEVEDVLVSHASISEVAIVGAPCSKSGEKVVAFVVCHPDKNIDLGELRSFAKRELTSYKLPVELILKEELPKTNIGKILRRALRDELHGAV